MENIEVIDWKKSKYERGLDLKRVNKKKPKIQRTDLHNLDTNITYDELQILSFKELSHWVDDLRSEIVDLWKNNTPPIIGKSKEDVVKSFKKLKDYDLSKIWVDDKNYPLSWLDKK